ncbi:Segregation and condensation protein A [Anaerococcus prevotii]|uniref:Segregation and condensation protein A n=1 Tax=Anaerococcus prevotii (strain ATCC 9321 / DSM 20548 / JCM 6508 / NCTC 11806 / PC1) TaxID=525919 RepID=C7RHU2_ANAPD|nr:segregation/condensation protein A [Anaerococcus prevotii]ACV29053.1 chromosome segregation and condensation protein ScpA [Anaerococcus prevotii DSM 20548]SUU94726.1 Segregation and condensation protein A [Anaerococcus prevotii]
MSETRLNIELEAFTGPFDLLLKLIEKKKIDIYDIELEEITNSYLEEINKLNDDIENLSEFIYIASILLTIKANKLMPKDRDDDLEEEFLSYLIYYKKIKSVEDDFKLMEDEARKIYSKYQEDLSQFERYEEVKIDKDINILTQEFRKLMANLEKKSEKSIVKSIKQEDVNAYVEKIKKTLNFTKKLDLSSLTDRIKNKAECIATFLALLELVKLKEISLEAKGLNSFLVIKR